MWEDPIVRETREAREKLVDEFGGDLDALYEHLLKVQERYRDRVVTLPPKKPTGERKVS
jgi:hypothetical protein